MTEYIITDPVYILSDEVWRDICDQCSGLPDKKYTEKFNSLTTKALNKLAGTRNAVACHTGFGDWDNQMYGSDESAIIERFFTADSGMVCVVRYTKKIKDALTMNGNDKLISKGGIAVIETVGKVTIEMDTSNEEWTVVHIDDEEDCFSSHEIFDEDYEDDDEDYDDDEDDYDEDDEDEDEGE